jgi:predicted transcriptional regulator
VHLNTRTFLVFFPTFPDYTMSTKRIRKELQQLGETIRRIRLEKGLSQFDLEKITDIDRGAISRIERGQKDVQLSTIIKLAEGLEVSTRELFEF